jgi:segregation and condensation protein B
MNLKSQIESLLFISSHPLSIKKIAEMAKRDIGEIEKILSDIMEDYKNRESGIQLVKNNSQYQMMTNGSNSSLVKDFLKDEMTGELTRPSLETLTVVAYRGPITKNELEQIRGVNCSMIIRNLMIRGLIEAKEDKKSMATFYNITFDFMRYLGVNDISELPDYERLHSDKILDQLLKDGEKRGKEEIKPDNNSNNSNQGETVRNVIDKGQSV